VAAADVATAELHLHLYGCVQPPDFLRHLATRERVDWDGYEAEMSAAYGVVPPTREIVGRFRAGDPSAERRFRELFVFGDADGGNFARFQAKMSLLRAGSTLYDPLGTPAEARAELATVTARVGAGHRRRGVSYAEHRLLLDDLPQPRARVALETVLAAYATGRPGLTERLAVSLDRADPWAGWDLVRELALGPSGRALSGVDFCHVEEGHPPRRKAAFFAAVREFNDAHPRRALAVLYHVGESFLGLSLESAVRWVQEAAELGAHRLGHAIALGVDPAAFGEHTRAEPVSERLDQIAYDLAHIAGLAAAGVRVDRQALARERDRLAGLPASASVAVAYDRARLTEVRNRQRFAMAAIRATGAVIEVCPTSNRRIGAITEPAAHPVFRFLEAGLPVVVSTDNPGILGVTPADEVDWVSEHTGRGEQVRRELVATAWRSRSEVLSGRAEQQGER
jgi:hypothetical protein